MKLFLIIVFMSAVLSAQADMHKWGKAVISYQENTPASDRSYGIEKASLSNMLIDGFTNTYWIFISDVDGDNCPFSPSCSSFFVESVKETNIFQGTLMFADRLTRDTNFFNRQYHYPYAKNGRLYDVPSNYKLNAAQIKYIPPFASVNDE